MRGGGHANPDAAPLPFCAKGAREWGGTRKPGSVPPMVCAQGATPKRGATPGKGHPPFRALPSPLFSCPRPHLRAILGAATPRFARTGGGAGMGSPPHLRLGYANQGPTQIRKRRPPPPSRARTTPERGGGQEWERRPPLLHLPFNWGTRMGGCPQTHPRFARRPNGVTRGRGRGTPRFCAPPPLALFWGTRTGVSAQTQTRPPCLCAGATPERGCGRGKGPLPPSARKGGREPEAAQAPPSPVCV